MKGSIREVREGVWQLRVGGGLDPGTGRYRSITRTHHGSRRSANRALADLVADVEAGILGSGKAGTFGDLAAKWMRHNKTHLSPTTVTGYQGALDLYILPVIGAKAAARVTTDDINTIIARVLDRALAPATAMRALRVVSRCLEYAVQDGMLEVNVAKRARKPRMRRHELTPPSQQEMRAVLGELERTGLSGPEGVLAVRLLIVTGCRRGELVALRWSNLDAAHHRVHIEASVVLDGKGGLVRRDPKTEASVRWITVDEETLRLAALAQERLRANAKRIGFDLVGDPYLFAGDLTGKYPWDPSRVSQLWKRAAKRAGVDARLHDIRHAHVTELLGAGIDVRAIAARVGHASTQMTLDVYAAPLAEKDKQAAAIAAGFLDTT